MDYRIIQFVTALRAKGVRISLAESKDAFDAINTLGIQDRENFRISLRTTLIKESADLETFDEIFPLFFSAQETPRFQDTTQNLTPEQAQQLAQALRQFTQKLQKMLEKMLQGKPLSRDELDELSQLTNLDEVSDPKFQEWKLRQMEQALEFREVRQALEEMLMMLQQFGMDHQKLEQMKKDLQSNQEAVQEQMRQYIGDRILENMSQQSKEDAQSKLFNRPFEQLSEEDMRDLRREIRRMAASLRTRLALRLKRAKTGQLDVKATLRSNLKYGNIPLEIHHRDQTKKPKVVVLCDISTSMRHCSELMLSMLFAIQDQISKTHAFAYIDHLEYISPHLSRRQSTEAISDVLRAMPSGHYNTDLGNSLDNLSKDYLQTIDHHSTFIIVGDGRNNYNNPRLDLFTRLARRSRYTIWLNPELMNLWGSGDSDMLKYAPYCHRTFQVSNLEQLAMAVDHLLVQP